MKDKADRHRRRGGPCAGGVVGLMKGELPAEGVAEVLETATNGFVLRGVGFAAFKAFAVDGLCDLAAESAGDRAYDDEVLRLVVEVDHDAVAVGGGLEMAAVFGEPVGGGDGHG